MGDPHVAAWAKALELKFTRCPAPQCTGWLLPTKGGTSFCITCYRIQPK